MALPSETLCEYMADAARRQQTTETLARLYGKLRLERRNGAPRIFARTHLQGKYILHSTGEQTLPAATTAATDWYLELRDRTRKGEDLHGRSFAAVAEALITHANQSEVRRRMSARKSGCEMCHCQPPPSAR